MSLPSNQLRQKMIASIGGHLNDYPEVAERWRAGDPLTRAMLTSVVETVVGLSQDNAINIAEPFIKSKDSTIIADAINKGILPAALPCQHLVTIENNGNEKVSLSQGRLIEDGTGRQWRIMATVNVGAGETKNVLAEQSVVKDYEINIPISEPFFRTSVSATDDAYIAAITVRSAITDEPYTYTPKFMNTSAGDLAYTLHSEDLETITLMFGDSTRAGTTVQAGDTLNIGVTQCYGEVDTSELSSAALSEIYEAKESKLTLYFKSGEVVRTGSNPLTIAQLRLLASYPAMYDQNAVFMGNFDFLIRKHFMQRFSYMAVWNESINEKHYGPSFEAINHLFLAVVPKNISEKDALIEDTTRLIGNADSLLKDRVHIKEVEQKPYQISITGRLASVHDIDAVKTQIKELLIKNYGKGSLAASYYNADGFNKQEIAMRIRDNIPAFQDRISDFSIDTEDTTENPIKPHQWAYVSEDSLTIDLVRTADTGTAIWTL